MRRTEGGHLPPLARLLLLGEVYIVVRGRGAYILVSTGRGVTCRHAVGPSDHRIRPGTVIQLFGIGSDWSFALTSVGWLSSHGEIGIIV